MISGEGSHDKNSNASHGSTINKSLAPSVDQQQSLWEASNGIEWQGKIEVKPDRSAFHVLTSNRNGETASRNRLSDMLQIRRVWSSSIICFLKLFFPFFKFRSVTTIYSGSNNQNKQSAIISMRNVL